MMPIPRLPDLVVAPNELPKLAETVEKFLVLALLVMEVHKGPYHQAVLDLRNIKTFWQRFSDPMVKKGFPNPVKVLELAGQVKFQHVGQIMALSSQCSSVALFFAKLQTMCLQESMRRTPSTNPPITIDPRKMN